MQYVFKQFNYDKKDENNIGKLDSLIVGRSNVIYETGEMTYHLMNQIQKNGHELGV